MSYWSPLSPSPPPPMFPAPEGMPFPMWGLPPAPLMSPELQHVDYMMPDVFMMPPPLEMEFLMPPTVLTPPMEQQMCTQCLCEFAARDEFAAECRAKDMKIQILEQSIATYQAREDVIRKAFENLQSFSDKEKRENDSLKQQLKTAKDSITEKDMELVEIDKTMEELESRLNTAREGFDQQGDRTRTLEIEVLKLKEENDDLISTKAALQEKFEALHERNQELKYVMDHEREKHRLDFTTWKRFPFGSPCTTPNKKFPE